MILRLALWNFLAAADPTLGSFPNVPITNRTSPRAEKRIEALKAVNDLADALEDRFARR